MRASKALLLLPAVLALAACGVRYTVDGRSFATADEALAYIQSTMDEVDELIAKIEPLPSPTGGPVVIVLPTRDHGKRLARLEFPNREEEWIKFLAGGLFLFWPFEARMIERRNIFEEVRIVWAETPEGVDVPPNGYLIWRELRSLTTKFWHIVAAGELQTTEIKLEVTELPDFLGEIEDFVKTHRPAA